MTKFTVSTNEQINSDVANKHASKDFGGYKT